VCVCVCCPGGQGGPVLGQSTRMGYRRARLLRTVHDHSTALRHAWYDHTSLGSCRLQERSHACRTLFAGADAAQLIIAQAEISVVFCSEDRLETVRVCSRSSIACTYDQHTHADHCLSRAQLRQVCALPDCGCLKYIIVMPRQPFEAKLPPAKKVEVCHNGCWVVCVHCMYLRARVRM